MISSFYGVFGCFVFLYYFGGCNYFTVNWWRLKSELPYNKNIISLFNAKAKRVVFASKIYTRSFFFPTDRTSPGVLTKTSEWYTDNDKWMHSMCTAAHFTQFYRTICTAQKLHKHTNMLRNKICKLEIPIMHSQVAIQNHINWHLLTTCSLNAQLPTEEINFFIRDWTSSSQRSVLLP
jgi:hypothetical protein